MADLRELIRQYPELGDVFANFETRILFLENSLPYHRELEFPKPEIPDLLEIRQLKYQVEQAKAGYLHLQNKLNGHLDKNRKKMSDMYV